MKGRIKHICISKRKGTKKHPVPSAVLQEGHGIVGDGHAGKWHRQVSLLSEKSIEKMRIKGLKAKPGDFAENIGIQGIDLSELNIGDILKTGHGVHLEVTQIGKECHAKCAIYEQAGDCIMPKEGIFARVLKSGILKQGDEIYV